MTSRPVIQWSIVAIALAGLGVLVSLAALHSGTRHSLLTLVGFGAGIALYHASFGFTSAWRRMFKEHRSEGLRAQLWMLGLAMLVFFPLLMQPLVFGQPLSGFVNPVGLALGVGAFLFGIGMQLGGGCGSGTLYTAGGGSTRMLVTLAAFITGSVIATADPLSWSHWPQTGGVSIVEQWGITTALITGLGSLAAIYALVLGIERARHGIAKPLQPLTSADWLRGPWPLIAGALALALVNIATLVIAGRPWGITSAFALWGAKILTLSGIDVASWPYWRGDTSLQASLFSDATSVMNFGIILGALAAAALAGRFAPQAAIPVRSLFAAILGGLLMGIGARLATGCNIGAFFSGLASGSLHGLVWLIFAIPGNAIGMRLRPRFGLDP
jgi:uncharacterized protein